MKKQHIVMATLFLVTLTGRIMASPIINVGFETGDWTGWKPDDWAYGGMTWGLEVTTYVQNEQEPWWAREAPHSGQYSRLAYHDGQANWYSDFYQDIDISDGWTILSFWLNIDLNPNGTSNTGSWAGVDIREHDYGNVIANLVTIGGSTPGYYGTDGWQYYRFDLTNYTSLDELSLTFWLQTANNYSRAYQRIYVDDVELVPEPATVLLLGLGGIALRRFNRRVRRARREF